MNGRRSRRGFLQSAATGVAALAAGALAPDRSEAAGAPGDIPIIDPHQHLWDLRRFQPPWLKGEPKLNRPYTMEDYLRAAEGLNVVKTVYMEVDVDPRQQVEEAEYVIEVSRGHKTPMAAGVISGRPASPDFEAHARRFHGSPYIKGVRQVLQVESCPKGFCLQPEFVRSIRLLGELGLCYDICMRPGELADGIRLADLCPGTRFVLDHCGNADAQWTDRTQWERDMTEFGKRKHVVCKISGVIKTCAPGSDKARALEPIVKHAIHAFGWDRVMFASDWPVCTLTASLAEWVQTLRRIVRDATPEQQRQLFHDNAARFYGVG